MRTRNTFFVRGPEGLAVRGGDLNAFARLVPSPSTFEQIALTWRTITPIAWEVDQDAVRQELKTSFEWEDVLVRCASALAGLRADLRQSRSSTSSPAVAYALGDDWPCTIVDAAAVHRWLAMLSPRISTTTNAGVLAVLAIALRSPWSRAARPLPEPAATQRFWRLAMIGTDLADQAVPDGPFTTARHLLNAHRTQVTDFSVARVVRAYEIYAEHLPSVAPRVVEAFAATVGVSVERWIFSFCALNAELERRWDGGRTTMPLIDLSDAAHDEASTAVRAVRILAAQTSWYKCALDERGTFSVTPFRERPIISLGGERYLVVHPDFLLTAADEGVVARIRESLSPIERKALVNPLGSSFQMYVARLLTRAFGASDVAEVPAVRGEQRCDFAIRVGEDLLLVDAKQMHLGNEVIDGADGFECLVGPLRGGLRQVLATAQAIRKNDLTTVVPDLAAARDWQPRRCLGWVVVQPDLAVWFESLRNLIEDEKPGLATSWWSTMTGLPLVVPVSSIELLEAAGEPYVRELLDALATDAPQTYGGIPRFLSLRGYRGPVVSEAVDSKRRAILADAG